MSSFKPIIAKVPNIQSFRNTLKTELEKAGKKPKKDFEATTRTWDGKPDFQIKVSENGNKIELFVGVESNWSKGKKANVNDIYMFVTRGTSERHALMSPDFSPKTKKRVIGSSSGRGGVVRVSKDIHLDGIDAREFEEEITKKNKKPIQKDVEKSLETSAKKVKWAI